MEKVRFGVVGTNFITDWFLAGARQEGRFVLTAVCSRSAGRAEAFAARHGARLWFTSLEEMARSAEVDAVYIATPNALHAAQSILCMRHGKHVLCEKPFASNAREAGEMVAASERYGVTLMEAMRTTLLPNFRILLRSLDRAGTLRRYFASYCQYSSRYDRFKAGELPNAFNPALSNGALMDLGVYAIYPMVLLFGMPRRLQASATLLPSGTDGQGTVSFDYEGMEATVLYSKIADSTLPVEIQGEEGSFTLDHIARMEELTFRPRGAVSGEPVVERLTVAADRDPYSYEVTEFIDLVLAGRRESAINTLENSLRTMMLLDEIRRQIGVRFPADAE